MNSLKRTPLFAAHQESGGKLIEFGGWEMPVYYTSITDEHLAVRRAAGIFDISHMGEVVVSGSGAASFLNRLLTNDIRKLQPGDAQYSLMCNPEGGVMDDLYVYCTGPDNYLIIVNASRTAPDVQWMTAQAQGADVQVRDVSESYGAVAVQGPRVAEFIDAVVTGSGRRISELRKNQIALGTWSGESIYVARTGYTGEDGFEIVAPAAFMPDIWNGVLELGRPLGIKPCGLGARDTLRTEVCYPLYGHELDENTTPIEAGLGFFVSLDKGDYNGRARHAEQKANGVPKKLVAFKMNEKSAPPRPQYPVLSAGPEVSKIGVVASGTQSPSLGIGIGMAYLPPLYAKVQTSVHIEIRGKAAAAVVVPKPIYKPAA